MNARGYEKPPMDLAFSAEQKLGPLRFDEAEGHRVSLERKAMAFLAYRAPASAPHFPDAIACRSLDASPCSSASRSRPDHRVSVESLTQDPGNLAQNLWRRRSLVPWNTSSFPVGALYFPRASPSSRSITGNQRISGRRGNGIAAGWNDHVRLTHPDPLVTGGCKAWQA